MIQRAAMAGLWLDLRYGWRGLRRSPVSALAIIVLVALGIGGVAALFSPLYSLVLAPLPYPHSEQLVRIGGDIPLFNSYFSTFEERGRLTPIFSGVMAEAPVGSFAVQISPGRPRQVVKVDAATEEFCETLGVMPRLGRSFAQEKSNKAVVLISDRLWRAELGSAPGVVGRSIPLEGQTFVVIGVMPKDFDFPGETDVWMLMAPGEFDRNKIEFVARLRLGLSVSGGANQLRAIPYKRHKADGLMGNDGPVLESLQTTLRGDRRPLLWILLAVSILFLLLVCAGAANLLLAQGVRRHHEMAVRLVHGAGRWRLVRQLLAETLLTVALAGLLGILLSTLGARWLRMELPDMQGSHVFVPATLELAGGLVLAVTILCGLAPALQAARVDLNASLKGSASGITESALKRRFFSSREFLVGAQLALALILLVSAGLLLRSLAAKLNAPFGFDSRNVAKIEAVLPQLPEMTAALANFKREHNLGPQQAPTGNMVDEMNRALQPARKKEAARSVLFQHDARHRLAELPEVVSVDALSPAPFSAILATFEALGYSVVPARVYESQPDPASGLFPPSVDADQRFAGPHTFEILGAHLLAGRNFTPDDVANELASEQATPGEQKTMLRVVIVSDALARRFWPSESAIGKKIYAPDARTIVGVVSDFRDNFDPVILPAIYSPYTGSGGGASFVVKLRPGASFVHFKSDADRVLTEMEPGLPHLDEARDHGMLFDVTGPALEVEDVHALASEVPFTLRLALKLLGCFAGMGVIVAGLGVYAVAALMAAARAREVGIRIALGAETGRILRLALWRSVRIALAALPVGLFASWVLARSLSHLLYQVGAADPVTYVASSAFLLVIALLAGLLPALRAASTDPAIALRYE